MYKVAASKLFEVKKMSKRIEENYAKLIQLLYPFLRQAEEFKASIRPITEIAELVNIGKLERIKQVYY